MIITIDGPAAAGKGTLARRLADKYNLIYFDTGMVYRAVGLEMILGGFDLEDETKALSFAQSLTFTKMIKLSKHPDFRNDVGANGAYHVARYQAVRDALLKMQQDFAKTPVYEDGTPAQGAIYDGRDTGTVVCPNANIKFYITASPEVRAERRLKEFKEKDMDITFEQVLAQTKARDDSDYTRKGTWPAEDAIIFDTSTLSIDEVFAKACEVIDEKIK